jgi:hypothetical protein
MGDQTVPWSLSFTLAEHTHEIEPQNQIPSDPGICPDMVSNLKLTTAVEAYNTLSNSWRFVMDLPDESERFPTAICEDILYVIAGVHLQTLTVYNKVRRYEMKFLDLQIAFESGTDTYTSEVTAYICKATGDIIYDDEEVSGIECPVEGIEFDDGYIRIPNKHDLDLGQNLVWDFVAHEIPGLYNEVRNIFRKKSAYHRYKQYLFKINLLQKWYDFESTRTKQAILDWCADQGLKVDD